jgi:hypothetical protein
MMLLSLIIGISIGASLLAFVLCLLDRSPGSGRRAVVCVVMMVVLGVAFAVMTR